LLIDIQKPLTLYNYPIMNFSIQGPSSMSLYEILRRTALTYHDSLAVICGDVQYTYSQLNERVIKLSNALQKMGCEKNDKVAIISKNCHRFLESYYAVAKIGAVLVPINYRLAPEDFVYILQNSQAKILLAQPEFIPWIEKRKADIPGVSRLILTKVPEKDLDFEAVAFYEDLIKKNKEDEIEIEEIDEDQCAQIYYTSGTTGTPKGVILTHKNNEVHVKGTISELALSHADRWLHVSSMFHLADSWAVWSITQAGGVHVMVPSFEPKNVLEAIEEHKVTLSNFIPTMLNILVNCKNVGRYDVSSLRLIMSGGAPIAKDVVRKVIDIFGPNYIQTYGLTETSPFLTMSILEDDMKDLPFEDRLNVMVTTGRPFYNVQLKVVKEDGEEVKPDNKEVGEIIVKGETISPGYWELPKETSLRFHEGWLYTRDLAVLDSQDYVTIIDRKDDMIITGGENVYSIEIENVLYSHPKIMEAAVIGLPDPIWGEKVTAVVVIKEGREAIEKEIIEFCKDKLAHFKAPKKVIFTKALPKTGSQKIYKFQLREMYKEM
jgi:acyl-CoA synthetase (AMP-forming)/AMP-acid ligase II